MVIRHKRVVRDALSLCTITTVIQAELERKRRTMVNSKFENVSVEDDTRILSRREAKLGIYDVLYEQWEWDGIYAESFLFVNDDIAKLDDAQLEHLVRTSPIVKEGSGMTIQRSTTGFTFVNFNFQQGD